MTTRKLYFGDNLEIMRRHVADDSVDLVYLDPPFNSNQSYNVLFKERDQRPSQAQIEAFDDTWHWTPETQREYESLITGPDIPRQVSKAIDAIRLLLGENDVMAYLVMMTPRLLEIHRALRSTGSMYLHCDPTASHYLKIICDQVFDPRNFKNEIIWKRTSAHSSANRAGPVHDVLLFYTKGRRYTWNDVYQPYDDFYIDQFYTHYDVDRRRWRRSDLTGAGVRYGETGKPWRGIDVTAGGRHWAYPPDQLEVMDREGRIHWPKKMGGMPMLKRYLEEQPGVPVQDVWTDIKPLHNLAAERLGFPTQKPQALLERIIRASSNPDDMVLDPFCGCGTAVAAAEALGRSWQGIDITYLAIALIEQRLNDAHPGIKYDVLGVPRDESGARALFESSTKNFEMWAVRLIGGRPNPKWGGDEGVDGIVRFYLDGREWGTVLVSVKGGDSLNPGMVRDLVGTVKKDRADMGILITRAKPTKGMYETAIKDGTYLWPGTGQEYPRIQLVTVEDLLRGVIASLPPIHGTYAETPRATKGQGEQLELG